jgi:hypothetical protein
MTTRISTATTVASTLLSGILVFALFGGLMLVPIFYGGTSPQPRRSLSFLRLAHIGAVEQMFGAVQQVRQAG